jgi:signal transduction histidine kinase
VSFRTFSKSLIAFVVVALSSYLLEVRLHREGIPSYYLILISNFLVGLVAAALVYVLSIREKQRQEYVECRLRVIADMNHHIRNALQVISFYSRKGEKHEIGIREAVERIQWALREVLPQLPDSMPEPKVSDRVLDIQKLRSAELSRR